MSDPQNEFDFIVLGAGAGGLSAALIARLEGQSVLLLESTPHIGGTAARASGTAWIPDNHHLRRAGVRGDRAAAREYLAALAGGRGDAALREAFLAAAPEMIEYLETQAGIAFQPYLHAPDYRQALPGAALGLRPLEPLAFDGRDLGEAFAHLGWPIPELMLFGGLMLTRTEAARLLGARGWIDAARLGTSLVSRFALDRLRYRRGTRLVLGNALVARLYHALLQRGVPVWREVTVRALLRDSGRVGAVRLHVGAGEHVVTARRAVILAGGGFPADAEWRSRWLPALTSPHTPAAPGCYGSSMRLALDVGAVLGEPGEDNALWFPSSIVRRRDGSTAVYPHIVLDRAKPGLIAVNAAGRRFCNEAVSYHEFTRAMLRSGAVPAWLVCDRRFIGRYGLGLIRPRSLSLGREIARGYLHTAPAIAALAQAIGVDAAGLAETVAANNGFARSGVDTLFGKGGNAYDRAGGDAEHAPNPCLGPIDRPPFYAVPVVPTPLGTSLGLRCNAAAQVCDATDAPISGLYACGNDMHSVFAGEYPGAGAQIGAAMTFAYIAVRHAIGVADSRAAAS